VTILANHRNTVFTDSRYALGAHMLRHALDYVVTLYIGPVGWLPYVESSVVIAWLIAATPATRFGALWLIVALLPYLGFRSENPSRYLYLPAIGFSLAIAGAVAAASDRLSRRYAGSRKVVQAGAFVVAVFIAARFARFDALSIRSEVESLEPWRAFVNTLAARTQLPARGVVHVTPPPSDLADGAVDGMYLDPIARWVYQNYDLTVVVDR
jgi:hypothetical protein